MSQELVNKFLYLGEVDQLKSIERQTLNFNGERRENTAEHSWSLAMAVMLFKTYSDLEINVEHCLKLALSHDLVEIYAGDTFAYDTSGLEDKRQREMDSATKLFRLNEERNYREFYDYWIEYEEKKTNESLYVNALDRLLPIYFNSVNKGHSWQKHGVTSSQVIERNGVIKKVSAALWKFTLELVDDCVERGILQKG